MQGWTSAMSKSGCARAENKKSAGAESMPKIAGITEITGGTEILGSPHDDVAKV